MADNYDDVSAAVHALNAATAAFEAAKLSFEQALGGVYIALEPLAKGSEEPARDPRLVALARHLYWNEPQIPSHGLAEACGFVNLRRMLDAIGSVPSGVLCADCGRDIPRTSRTWHPKLLGEYTANPRVVCPTCDKEISEARDRSNVLHWARHRYVERAGVEAPAWEWLLACAIVRAYPPVSTRIEPGSEEDRQTGTWYEFDSSIYVGRIVGVTRDRDSVANVRSDAAETLVTAALNAAAWDSSRVCEITSPFSEEAPTYVLSRLQERIETTREHASAKAREVYPDGHKVTYFDGDERIRGWRDTVRVMHSPD